jgi:linoleoyl-CoA desaturase
VTLLDEVRRLGEAARLEVGAEDVAAFRRMKRVATLCELVGRVLLFLWAVGAVAGWPAWLVGMGLVAFHLSVEAQLNHTLMHGALAGVAGAPAIDRYETMAVPFRTQTWRRAHQIHHANPSLLSRDPDTLHPLFRVHSAQRFRAWHRLNVFLGAVFVFEAWAGDYDRFLKDSGHRDRRDHRERYKLAAFFVYQYVLFSLLCWPHALAIFATNLTAVVIRNFVFIGLQLGSSVGRGVSTRHAGLTQPPRRSEWVRFQIETSKNFALTAGWRDICGGLDRHIEHHLFPHLPPRRLHALSRDVRRLCDAHGIAYEEHTSVWASLGDSVAHLWSLSHPHETDRVRQRERDGADDGRHRVRRRRREPHDARQREQAQPFERSRPGTRLDER